jgi:hypothetical protein
LSFKLIVAYWALLILAPKSTQADTALASENAAMTLVNCILDDIGADFEGIDDWML